MQAPPYHLLYSVEVILPIESQVPTLRITIQEELSNKENVCLPLKEFEALDEKRLKA